MRSTDDDGATTRDGEFAMTPTTGVPHLSLVDTGEVRRADSVSDLAETYTRLADELAAMVEAEADRSARTYAVLADALGELHTALDELGARGAEL